MRAATSTQLFRLLSTHLLFFFYFWATLPTVFSLYPSFPSFPFPHPFSLWLSISNLAIFVALLWALINNCVCHRLPSPQSTRTASAAALVLADVVAAHQHLTMLQFYYHQTAKSAQTKYYYVPLFLCPLSLSLVLYLLFLLHFGTTVSFFIFAFNCSSPSRGPPPPPPPTSNQMKWLMVAVVCQFGGSTRLIYGHVVAHKHSNQLIAVIFQLASSFA